MSRKETEIIKQWKKLKPGEYVVVDSTTLINRIYQHCWRNGKIARKRTLPTEIRIYYEGDRQKKNDKDIGKKNFIKNIWG